MPFRAQGNGLKLRHVSYKLAIGHPLPVGEGWGEVLNNANPSTQ